MLTFGEGWHNNHHAHPVSARHGLAWYEFDMNWIGISALKALGLAWDIKVAKIRQPLRRRSGARIGVRTPGSREPRKSLSGSPGPG